MRGAKSRTTPARRASTAEAGQAGHRAGVAEAGEASEGSRPRARVAEAGEASEGAYARLRALIVNGLLAPGSPLIESDLSARLGVSRTPVRAALLRLQLEGFVRWTPTGARGGVPSVVRRAHHALIGRGPQRGSRAGGGARVGDAPGRHSRRAIVSPLTAEDLREVFLMVGALEATAARQVAGLDARRRQTLAAALDDANRGLRAAIERRPPDLVAAQDLHVRFHRACVDAVAGPRLRVEIKALVPQAERYQRVYSAATMYAIDDFVSGHEAIIAAIRAGDGDAAEQAAGADWRVTAERHCEMVAILGERGSW